MAKIIYLKLLPFLESLAPEYRTAMCFEWFSGTILSDIAWKG